MGLFRRLLHGREVERLRDENAYLCEALVEALANAQALNAKLVESQDRVIVSRFDAPMQARGQAQPNNDGLFPAEALSDVLSVEDDNEFMERVG